MSFEIIHIYKMRIFYQLTIESTNRCYSNINQSAWFEHTGSNPDIHLELQSNVFLKIFNVSYPKFVHNNYLLYTNIGDNATKIISNWRGLA